MLLVLVFVVVCGVLGVLVCVLVVVVCCGCVYVCWCSWYLVSGSVTRGVGCRNFGWFGGCGRFAGVRSGRGSVS